MIAPAATSRSRHGFTLAELLVVLTIIVILAALLLPALSRARNKSAQASDINNLKQQTTALHLYSTDNDDTIAWPNWEDGDRPDRPGWLYTLDATASGPERYRAETGIFWTSLHSKKLYACPLDRPEEHRERQQQASSYVMNGAVIGYNLMKYPAARLATLRPEDIAFWETDERHPRYFNDGSSFPTEGVSQRHSRGAIYAAFGGTVSYVPLKLWYEQVADRNRNRLWCYPGSANGR